MNDIDRSIATRTAADLPRWPAEFEPHACCWMVWPVRPTWGDKLDLVEREFADVAHAIAQFEPVKMIAAPDTAARARRLLAAGIEVIELPISDSWFRDSGPSFVKTPQGQLPILASLNIFLGSWGDYNFVLFHLDMRLAFTSSQLFPASGFFIASL